MKHSVQPGEPGRAPSISVAASLTQVTPGGAEADWKSHPIGVETGEGQGGKAGELSKPGSWVVSHIIQCGEHPWRIPAFPQCSGFRKYLPHRAPAASAGKRGESQQLQGAGDLNGQWEPGWTHLPSPLVTPGAEDHLRMGQCWMIPLLRDARWAWIALKSPLAPGCHDSPPFPSQALSFQEPVGAADKGFRASGPVPHSRHRAGQVPQPRPPDTQSRAWDPLYLWEARAYTHLCLHVEKINLK